MLYSERHFPFIYRWVHKALSTVRLADDDVASIKSLAEQGIVIYALKYKSQLDSIIVHENALERNMPRPEYVHGVNMIFWQPFSKAFRVIFFFVLYLIFKKKFLSPSKEEYLKKLILKKRSAVIHLGASEYFDDPVVDNAMAQILSAQSEMDCPVYIIPTSVSYTRRREKEKENIIDILFSQTEHIGPLRRLVTYIRFSLMGKTALIMAEPVCLKDFMKSSIDESETLSDCLRRELLNRIDEEKSAIVGPYLKSRTEMISMVLRDEDLVELMEKMERDGRRSYASLKKEAKGYLKDIASDYTEIFINFWYIVLTWLWNNIYDGVILDREGISKIRNISKRMPFVIIPCHRSHIDYFLLSYVFYKNNIQLPFIWAGDNLSFFPLGYIFRKSGAFFVWRSFRGKALYAHVLARYVKMLLQEGLPLEFFIEGGRSRTGKMVMPKYGVLSMIIQAYQEKACENLAAIPIYIGYDRVIEEKSYLRELGGGQKETESTAKVIKSTGLLRRRYGHVYVNTGNPIYIKEYLESQDKTLEEMSVDERQSLYRKLGYEIVKEISDASIVTPYALTSAGLLSHDRRGIAQGELTDILNNFYDYLMQKKVNFAATLISNKEKAIQDALVLLDQSHLISKMSSEEEDGEDDVEQEVYSIEDDKRLNLEYYKNGILHFFLPLCFVAQSLHVRQDDVIPVANLLDDYRFFKKLFWNEFIFDINRGDDADMNDELSYLARNGMITLMPSEEGYGCIHIGVKARNSLKPFAGLIANYIESYWIVVRGCNYLKRKNLTQKDLLKKLNNLAARMYKKGEIRRSEAMSQANYRNALLTLQDEGILLEVEGADKSEKRDGTIYCLNEDRSAFDDLRRRLFRFI